jgi:lipopolysaccharide/colanic/teichoic acid biosynthesis glycosyltransferase/glycosyltransferase involved in cell wall biosynthesis
MHILYLHQYFCPLDGAGGTRSYEMARRLVAAGHRVTLITSSAFFPDSYDLKRTTRLTLDGIDLLVLRVPYGNRMGFGRRILAFLQFAVGATYQAVKVKDIDVVFATSTPLTIIIPGYVVSRAKGAPMVFEVRDLWPAGPIAMGALKHPISKWLAHVMERFAYRSAARLIALSPGMKDGIVRLGVPEDRVAMIPNACDVDLFRMGSEQAKAFLERFPHLEGGPLVVYGGTLGQINGVGYLADIAAAMQTVDPEVRFLICGDGAEREDIQAKAQRLGVLDRNLWIIPGLPKNEMPGLLASATVALSLFRNLPEMQHNSANKVFDALAAGKPIAVNYGGWQADLIESRGAGLVLASNDPSAAAQDLSEFLNDTDGLRRASEQASALAESRFNRDKLAGEFRGVLEQTASDDPAPVRRRRRTLFLKRAFDIAASAMGLLVLSPVLLMIAGLILVKMRRPVFFSQLRPGFKGRPIRLIKFRTMANLMVDGGGEQPDVERFTPLGRFLRRTSLDELPELFNVLIGDMSLVGPRPLLMEYLPYYSTEQARRHDVRPGITGHAQVHGRNALSWEEKFALDVWYVDHLGLGLDLNILWDTISVVAGGKGVSAEGHATMPRFDEIMARRQGAEDG